MKKTYLISLVSLICSASFGQFPALISTAHQSPVPEWNEYIHYQINTNKDTLYRSIGKQVEPFLYQEEFFSSEAYWQGVDRYVWEGENQVRIYRYNGSETLIKLEGDKIIEINNLDSKANQSIAIFKYNNDLLERVSIKSGQELKEEIFVYDEGANRLVKLKFYLNGERQKVLKFSYGLNGNLAKEELWAFGNLQSIATYSYRDSLLQSLSIIDLQQPAQHLKESRRYTYSDDGAYQIEKTFFQALDTEIIQKSIVNFDAQGRKIKEEISYSDNAKLEKEVFLFSYPQEENLDYEVLSLQADGR